ncbi:unnamed protein product [Hermetia illucens]|uniref:Lipase domain-containing protein n=2 Tax=Hermetia illucens TaxID=343691 RepID=A0A7R8UEJ9_HERIL|nr:unnamed protein product [Hermetia illucens]
MRATLALLVIGLTAVLGAPSYDPIVEKGWTLVPDENGNLKMVTLEELEFQYALAKRAKVVVKFTLYTRANPTKGEEMVPNDAAWLAQSNFNPANPTRVICHGWMGDGDSSVIVLNRDAYLSRGDYNVIGIDWSKGGGTINYIAARANVNEAATQVASYLDFLTQHGLKYNDVYLIGHSLGAHVVGMTGKYINGKVNTIYGLDPAMPLFFENKPDERLNDSDAEYVQTIQTNAGVLGFDVPIGNGAFYPNWGGDQPGCGLDIAGTCAHYRSWAYLAESITDDLFWAVKCQQGYEAIKEKYCPDKGSVALMGGEPSDHNAVGVYYLPTNTKEPYAKGKFFL